MSHTGDRPAALDLSGATILHVQPGDRLMFVVHKHFNLAQASEVRDRLLAFMPGVEVSVLTDIEEVIKVEAATT